MREKDYTITFELNCKKCGFNFEPSEAKCDYYSKYRCWPNHCGVMMSLRRKKHWLKEITHCPKGSCTKALDRICRCESCEGKFHGIEKWRNFHLQGTPSEWKLTEKFAPIYKPYL